MAKKSMRDRFTGAYELMGMLAWSWTGCSCNDVYDLYNRRYHANIDQQSKIQIANSGFNHFLISIKDICLGWSQSS